MTRGSILHIAPFIWSMGYGKGIFGVQVYKLFEKYGYNQLFVVPNVNVFNPEVVINSTFLKQAGLHGIVFKLDKSALRTEASIIASGAASLLGKSIWFLCYMFLSFCVSLKLLAGFRDVICIYAHTWLAVPQAYILSKLFRVPCVYRVYGIHNYSIALRENAIKFLLKPDLVVFKIPCDTCIITNDGTMGKAVAIRMGVPDDKILYLLDGVPDDFFNPLSDEHNVCLEHKRFELEIQSEKKVILYAGRIVGWKGVGRLIHVLHLIRKKKPEIDVCLVIAGDGYLRHYFEELACSLGLKDNVIFLEAVGRKKLRNLFAFSDIYLTLQDLTNLSNSVLEAMTQGLCVVAGDVGGAREIIENMKNGVLVPLFDLEKTADVIVDLLLNNDLRRSIGGEAQRYAKTHFLTWEERMKYELDWISERLLL